MAVDHRLNDYHAMKRELEALRARTGDGGGGGDHMDQRVTRLEGQFDRLADRIGGVETQLATLTERVAHLPSKGFIVTALGTAIAILGGAMVIAQRLGFFA